MLQNSNMKTEQIQAQTFSKACVLRNGIFGKLTDYLDNLDYLTSATLQFPTLVVEINLLA